MKLHIGQIMTYTRDQANAISTFWYSEIFDSNITIQIDFQFENYQLLIKNIRKTVDFQIF